MTKVLCTAAWGEDAAEYSALTFPAMRKYAQRVGAAFETLPAGDPRLPTMFWKNQYAQVLARYDRGLWLDADVLVRPDCPDLFSLVPRGSFAAHDELERADELEVYRNHQWVVAACKEDGLPIPESQGRHFNAGVHLAESGMAGLFKDPSGPWDWLDPIGEQARLNAQLFFSSFPIYHLPACFNCLVYHRPPRRWGRSCYLAHFAGPPSHAQRLLDIRALKISWGI